LARACAKDKIDSRFGEFGLLEGVVLHELMAEGQTAAEQPSLEEVGTPQRHAAE
jgi:hypothetical protein